MFDEKNQSQKISWHCPFKGKFELNIGASRLRSAESDILSKISSNFLLICSTIFRHPQICNRFPTWNSEQKEGQLEQDGQNRTDMTGQTEQDSHQGDPNFLFMNIVGVFPRSWTGDWGDEPLMALRVYSAMSRSIRTARQIYIHSTRFFISANLSWNKIKQKKWFLGRPTWTRGRVVEDLTIPAKSFFLSRNVKSNVSNTCF